MTVPVIDTGLLRLKRYLPRWLQGNVATDVAGAVGAQYDAVEALAIGDQLFVATATWGLAFDYPDPVTGGTIPSGWERDYGIPSEPADPLEERRARVLARMRRGALRTAADFAAFIQAETGQSCPPTVYDTYGLWVVFKLCEPGWPANFDALTADLVTYGPAHMALWLAPWDACAGLEVWQLDRMAWHAIDVLEIREFDGGDCGGGPCPPELLLDAIDATLLDEVETVALDLYEFCSSLPPGWVLERFLAVAPLGALSVEQVDAIDLGEME